MNFEKKTLSELTAYLHGRKELTHEEISALEKDRRAGVTLLLKQHRSRLEKEQKEVERLQLMLTEEKLLWECGYRAVAGVDEAGRGPLAGPVVAAAVVLKPGQVFTGLNDSKQLSAAKREMLFEAIIQNAESYGIGSASKDEIDDLNIHSASLLAMKRSLDKLNIKPDYILVDGFAVKNYPCRQRAIKKGDAISLSIAAASVLAKVSRDMIMKDLHLLYPQYGFNRNMGYGTAEHQKALATFGPCPEHRCSFKLNNI